MGLPEERRARPRRADRGRRRFVDLDERAARGGQLAQGRVERGRPFERRASVRSRAVPSPRPAVYGPVTACFTARAVRRWVAAQARARSRSSSAGGRPSVIGSRPASSCARTAASTSASRGASTGSGGRGRAPSSVANIDVQRSRDGTTGAVRTDVLRCYHGHGTALQPGSGSARGGRAACGNLIRHLTRERSPVARAGRTAGPRRRATRTSGASSHATCRSSAGCPPTTARTSASTPSPGSSAGA